VEELVDLYSLPDGLGEGRILGRYRRPVARSLAEAYVAAFTVPGDLVLDPFCHDAAVLSAAALAGRRAVAATGNPLLALLTRVEATPPSGARLLAALEQIRLAPKVDSRLGDHLDQLYATSCSRCQAPAPADAVIWERDAALPVLCEYRCPRCGHAAREPVPRDEVARHQAGDPQGIHRRLVAERLRVEGAPSRLLERLLDLYTPRSLYALTALTLKLELLFADGPLLDALRAALLQAMDEASTLHLATEEGCRPVGSLAPPRLFREANPWRAFVAAVQALARSEERTGVPLAAGVEGVRPGTACLTMAPLAQVAGQLSGQAALIVSHLPRFDPTFASLSYLWSGWLLGKGGSRAAVHLLGQRAPGWLPYQGALQAALAALAAALAPAGRLAVAFRAPASRYLEALLIAAAGADLTPVHAWHGLLDDRPAGPLEVRRVEHHLVFARRARARPLADPEAQVGRLAVHTAAALLAERAEPTPYSALHGPIWVALAREGLLAGARNPVECEALRRRLGEAVGRALEADAALEAVALGAEPGEALWRLSSPAARHVVAEGEVSTAHGYAARQGLWGGLPLVGLSPLADRVEALVREALSQGPLDDTDLARQVFARLQGQAPSWPLFEACLQAYGRKLGDGVWTLAEEEEAAAALAWQERMLAALATLATQLGYRPGAALGCDLTWSEAGVVRVAVRVQASAALGDVLGAPLPAATRGVLLVPGRRVALWRHKLAAVPLWRAALEGAGWAFLREPALLMLLEGTADRARFEAALGLDESGGQLALFGS
jgi:hypothetical protein